MLLRPFDEFGRESPNELRGLFLCLKFRFMNEIYLECQFNDQDKMIVSKGDWICFEIFENGESKTVCIDNKQAFTLIKTLESFRNE
jgi:hypothetical protein